MIQQIKFLNILTKPGIARMNLITVSIGFYLASLGSFYPYKTFAFLLIGTYLVAAACGIHNSYIERNLDAKMPRTQKRPFVTKSVNIPFTIFLSCIFLFAGISLHAIFVNLTTAFLSLLTWFLYICIYTPLKTKTWLNTFVGSFPGAIPIVGGWTASTGSIDAYSIMLFLVLFAWQHPHFYALALMYKDDYAKAGMKMLPVLDPSGAKTIVQIFLYTIIMIIASVLPFQFKLLGWFYLIGSLLIGLMMFYCATQLSKDWSIPKAKKLFFSSIIYLPLWFVLMVIDFMIRS